jgi:hydroxymethylglutaryl-CoA reductase (NADPH)
VKPESCLSDITKIQPIFSSIYHLINGIKMLKSLTNKYKSCIHTSMYRNICKNPLFSSKHLDERTSRYLPQINRMFSSTTGPSDEEILRSLNNGSLSHHKLESITNNDHVRAIKLRRQFIQDLCKISNLSIPIDSIPAQTFYNQVNGANCEGVIGYIPIPVGIAGPLQLDNQLYYVPMATTEGALIASTNRGARAIFKSGGATTVLLQDGMTRAPALECESLVHAAEVKAWIEEPNNLKIFQDAFSSTTRYGRLESISVKLAGRILFVRVHCFTGDAMGMNMIGKGSNEIVKAIMQKYPTIKLKTLSGNYCTDKKPAAVNWIEGRGKSVAAEAVIKKDIVKTVLKTNVDAMVEVNYAKNLIGSAMAGSIGGFNAHSANSK